MSYAKGKYAFGFCDKTGFRYPLNELVDEFKNGTRTGFRVGPDVKDPDHPQNFLGRVKINDPQSLINARPDPRVEPATATALGSNPFTTNSDSITVTEVNHNRAGKVRFYGAEAFAGVPASFLNRTSGHDLTSVNSSTYTIALPAAPVVTSDNETGGGSNVYAGPETETP